MNIGNRPSEQQWWVMVDKEMSLPVPLHEADISENDWVYFRPWGIIYVGFGMHLAARATLLSFIHGHDNWLSLARERKIPLVNSISELADAFLLEVEGTAFLSSMSTRILCGRREHLNAQERTVFRRNGYSIVYLED